MVEFDKRIVISLINKLNNKYHKRAPIELRFQLKVDQLSQIDQLLIGIQIRSQEIEYYNV